MTDVERNSFVYELEQLLQKYFGTDWVWSYKESDSPLTIYLNSATLDGLWKKEGKEELEIMRNNIKLGPAINAKLNDTDNKERIRLSDIPTIEELWRKLWA